MKRNILTKILGAIVLGLACTSCLDFDPKTQLADGNTFKSAKDFELFANQFYGYVRDFTNVITDAPHSDYRSDIMTTAGGNKYSAGNIQIPTSDGNYTGAYKRIRYCNVLLQKAEAYGGHDIAKYVAEAKFFRAYEYFELVQLYGDCILTLTPVDLDSPEMSAKRNDRGEVVDQIVKDLQEAIPDLPLESSIGAADKGRVSRGAAQAFLSRVALYEGTWQKYHNNNTSRASQLLSIAANAAKDVMDSNEYKLFYNAALGNMSYKYMFVLEDVQCNPAGLTKQDNHEYILVRRHDEILKPIGTNITKGSLGNVMWITRKYVNYFLCQDGLPIEKSPLFKGYGTTSSEFQNRDNRMSNQMLYHGEICWDNTDTHSRVDWKGEDADLAAARTISALVGSGYQNQKWATERKVKDNYESYDYPAIRYAEVLLNYAEAKYELDGQISDDDLNKSLNLVRLRVNPKMPKLSNSLVSGNGLNMLDEIRRERTVELFNEGFRLDDLKRWKTAETEMPQDLLGIKWTGTQFETLWSNDTQPRNADGVRVMQTNRVFEKRHYLLPLPSDQLQLNPNLGQNPDWVK